MADETLTNKLQAEARPLTAFDLPANFSYPLQDFLLRAQSNEQAIVKQANAAAQGAYDAQVSGEQNAESLSVLGNQVGDHNIRLFNVEQSTNSNSLAIGQLETDLGNVTVDITKLNQRVTHIEGDYVSLSKTDEQVLASPLGVTDSYSVNGVKVVGARVTGWTAGAGTASRGAFNANTTYPVGAAYTQSEVQAISNAMTALQQRVLALETDLRAHGLID